jgi:hypothetical protein
VNHKQTQPVRFRTLGVVLLATLVLPFATATSASAATTPTDASILSSMTTDVYQSINPKSQANLLTVNSKEIDSAKNSYGFTETKGVVFKANHDQKTGLVPVYRLHKNGDFIWIAKSSSSNELAVAQSKYGYTEQGINFYASTKNLSGSQPVYRFQKSGKHRYATTDAERTALTTAGWAAEGISFYGAKTSPVVTPPTTPPVNPADADGKFTMAVIPDTQQEVGTDTRFVNRTQWLVDNKNALDLRYVNHTGDVVNWDTPNHEQYAVASKAMKVLDDNKIQNSLTIGNHDTAAVGVGGSAADPKNTRTLVRNTTTFNSYFSPSRYPGITTFEAGKVDNAYQTFNAADKKWLVLTLELWPRTEVVDWAKTVVAAHPDYNVIVSTHSYLNGDGSIDQSASYGSNSAQYVYDNLVKQYPNIKVVLSGHVGEAGYREDVGVNGNKIVSYLGTFHSNTTNPVRTLEFDTKTGSLTTHFYGPSNGTTWAQYDRTTTGVTFVG